MLWYYGPTGTGKFCSAREEYPELYLKMCNKWWDNYQGEDVVLLEDFDEDHAKLVHHLKIWGDCYPFPAEVKGGSIKIRPKLIIVISNYKIEDIWSKKSDYEPILRRFKQVHFPETPFAKKKKSGGSCSIETEESPATARNLDIKDDSCMGSEVETPIFNWP